MRKQKEALNYDVIESTKRVRIHFNMDNPVEQAIASMMVKQLKAFMYKVKDTNLICMELALGDSLLSAYASYTKEADKNAKTKRRPSRGSKNRSGSKRGKITPDIRTDGKEAGLDKALRDQSGPGSDQG